MVAARSAAREQERVMEFLDAMHTYFRGEKQVALFLVPFGFATLGLAVYLLRSQAGGFVPGMVIPLLVIGAAAGVGGVAFAIRTDRQVAALEQQYRERPRALVDG